MTDSREAPPASGGLAKLSRRSTTGTAFAVLVVALFLGSGFVAVGHSGGLPSHVAVPAHFSNEVRSTTTQGPAITHGDLVVTAGENFTITSLPGARNYFQGGNITVQAGGTLYILNVTLSFVQFVTPTGTAAQRLAHIFHFVDQGTVKAYNSTITTDMFVLNAYPKLNLTVSGSMYLWNSSIEFPGWVNVQGASASLTLNNSSILRNPDVTSFFEPTVLQGDEDFAPTLVASAGGTINLFQSVVNNTYANNLSSNSTPGPAPLGLFRNISLGAPTNFSSLLTPTDPVNLTRDWLYPMGITSGEFVAAYNDSGVSATTMAVSVWYNGVQFSLGTATFTPGASAANATLAFPAGLTNAINAGGMLNYLNYTGDFGVGPSKIAIDVTSVVGPLVNISAIYLSLTPPISYDITATGAGSRLSTVDSTVDLTFQAVGASPTSLRSPLPWLANKISLTNGANASLANLTIPNIDPGVFETSAVVPDATSHAYLYRWAAFNITGRGGALPVNHAQVTAYSALNVSQADNATATAANNLQTWDPAIWGYLQYWDAVHQAPSYGVSGFSGVPALLLASNEITSTSLPDGYLLGDYHIRVVIPIATNNVYSFTWSLRPYPEGSAINLPGYGTPDYGPSHTFNSYFAGLAVTKVVVTAASNASTSVRIGQTFAVNVTVNDTGTAPIFSIVPVLDYNATYVLSSSNYTVALNAPGQNFTFGFTWKVNESVTGIHGSSFNHTFLLPIQWNYGLPRLGGGLVTQSLPETIQASWVKVTGYTDTEPHAPTHVDLTAAYSSAGTLVFNGSGQAGITLIALPAMFSGGAWVANGDPGVLVASTSHNASAFRMSWVVPLSGFLKAGTTYLLELHATYNGFTYNATVGTISVAPPPSNQNFFLQKFLGLPIWIWLVIAAAIVAGVLAFLFIARRQAAGKLVECGECGSLVPETAPACPKCGAEFETDLVRCSRCASTIPANSQFCPECAAQLLGKPGEGGSDPERQGYADYTERFRAEAKKELGENYNEGSFWDWWKRQPTYLSFSQWKLQQEQGAPRAGMMAPPAGTTERATPPPPAAPPKGKGPTLASALAGDRAAAKRPAQPPAPPAAAPAAGAAPAAPASSGLRPCPNCKKEIPGEYLVCPFCGSVTQ